MYNFVMSLYFPLGDEILYIYAKGVSSIIKFLT